MIERFLLLGFALAVAQAYPQGSGTVRGSVVDAHGGEPLANVQVQLTGGDYRTVSNSKGAFQITGVLPGSYVLKISTVGYHLENHPFHLAEGETKEFEVVLTPDTLRQTDKVEARPDPFETSRADSPSTLVLAGN